MHVISKKPIKVAYLFVAKHQRNCRDFHWGEGAEKQFRKGQTNVYLTLPRRLAVCARKSTLQRLHLYAEFASNRSNSERDVTLVRQDEMVHYPRGIIEQARVKEVVLRRPKGTNLCDDFLFDSRQLFGNPTGHESYLKTEIQQGPSAMERQGTAKVWVSRALALIACCRFRAYPWSTGQINGVSRFRTDRSLIRLPHRSFSECLDARTRNLHLGGLVCDLVTIGNKWSSHWHFSFFVINNRRNDLEAPCRRRQMSIEQNELDGKRRLCRRLCVNEIDLFG